jgi:hypothetical protein
MINLPIPKEINHPFFFSQNALELQKDHLQTFNSNQIFLHEIAFYSGLETIEPWKNPERYFPLLLTEWGGLQEELQGFFQNREKEKTLLPMKQGIGYFLESVYWTNGVPVSLETTIDVSMLQIKPVNASERLQFLMSKPTLYPSFIQLAELFAEHEKQYYKYLAIQSATKIK